MITMEFESSLLEKEHIMSRVEVVEQVQVHLRVFSDAPMELVVIHIMHTPLPEKIDQMNSTIFELPFSAHKDHPNRNSERKVMAKTRTELQGKKFDRGQVLRFWHSGPAFKFRERDRLCANMNENFTDG
ncbi:hypothetical protein LguiA_025856 [Lonicera macranthoides]